MPLTLATQSLGEPEIFASLQGEGPSAGRPVAFLRLSRCNLACQWCDTAYTWHFTGDERPHRSGETYDRKANQLTLSEAQVAERIAALGQDRLVITGGEPMLQAGALATLLELLPERLDAYATDTRAFFKFVIAQPGDIEEVLALKERYRFRPGHVFLMPEGTDSATIRAREEWLAPLCIQHGFRMSDRLHIHLYGDTRGT